MPIDNGENGAERDVMVDELDSVTLRLLMRNHAIVAGIAGFIALAALFIPDDLWIFKILRLLIAAPALLVAVVRMMQVNGVREELRRRAQFTVLPVDNKGPDDEETEQLML